MTTTTTPAPGPVAGQRDGRLITEVFADPATTEDFILRYGIHSPDALRAAMSRPNKGPALIRAILDDVIRAAWVNHHISDQVLRTLLNEPGLRPTDLTIMARTALARQQWPVLAAICAHHDADAKLISDTLWNANGRTAVETARATHTLLPVAVAWVVGQVGLHQVLGSHLGTPTAAQRAAILATASRWTAACVGNPDLATFLVNRSFTFTCEDELFAAGRAIAAAPSRSEPTST